jgi:Anti-anti-sigma regulatory factor (antagonist of anti-sigma factor)
MRLASQDPTAGSPSPLCTVPVRAGLRCARVALDGRVDYAALPRLKPLLRHVADMPRMCLRIDLSRVEFLDSCGIGLLLALHNTIEEQGGTVAFENHPPRVRRILERSGIMALVRTAMPCDGAQALRWAA